MTPLHMASLNLHIKIVSVLLKENQVGARVVSLSVAYAGSVLMLTYGMKYIGEGGRAWG